MDPRIDTKRLKDSQYEDTQYTISGFRILYADAVAEAARGFWAAGVQVLVSPLFNTKANLDYVGAIPDIKYYGADEMGEAERREFTAWYNEQEVKVFDNRHVLEQYCQNDVTYWDRHVACSDENS